MYALSRWIFYFLLFGHLIYGVNREVLSSYVLGNSVYNNLISKEAKSIMNFDHRTSQSKQLTSLDDAEFVPRYDDHDKSIQFEQYTTNGTLCFPWDSCSSRCGQQLRPMPYTCSCDELCSLFMDCCVDYAKQCKRENEIQLSVRDKFMGVFSFGCEILYMKYNLLIVNRCPKNDTDSFIEKLCTAKMPSDCTFSDNYTSSDVGKVIAKCKDSVFKLCAAKLRWKCNEKIESQCPSFISKRCKSHASSVCHKCNSKFWPVYDNNGFIYKNSYCAICNSQINHTVLSPYEISQKFGRSDQLKGDYLHFFIRRCAPGAIDTCHSEQRGSEMQNLCYSHSAAVVASSKKAVVYKNFYCALCNGEKMENLHCATTSSLMRGLIRPILKNFITGDIEGMKLDDIPAAFSILLNFGLDGRERMYFSSEGEEEMKSHQQKCGSGKIWDPFSEICRKLYCSTEFILVDYRCVRKENAEEEESNHENQTTVLPDARAEFVHLTLTAEIEMLDVLQFHADNFSDETVRESLATSLGINIERIQNAKFNISLGNTTFEEMDDFHPIRFTFEFDLYEDNVTDITVQEPSVDNIVAMLASSLSMNGFEFDINNVTSRIFEIHQTVSPLISWCNAEDGGEKKEYWNSEFSIILNEENSTISRPSLTKGIYVNKTGKFYPRDTFIAHILFQGYQFSGNLINVSGVAIVCDWKSKLNESCIRILVNHNEYITENDTLKILNESLKNAVDDSISEEAGNGSIYVCLKSLKTDRNDRKYHIHLDIVQALVSYVLLWISVIALTVVLITYIAFGSLRNLPGCNTMNLTFSLLAMQLTFIFGQRYTVVGVACSVVGHLLHYEILCCFMWMNVMAFDLFRTFGNRDILSNIRSKGKFLPRYMLYAYLSPFSIILGSSLLDYYQFQSPLAPHYGAGNICWISNKHAAIVFFAIPLAVIMCVNFVFFVLTILAMRSVKNVVHSNQQKSNQRGRTDLLLYARMALVIGLTWALSFAAAFVKEDVWVGKILTYLFIVFNTLQGVFIFWVFVCNKRVFELYKGAWQDAIGEVSKHTKKEGTSATISRLANVMKRTISTDTVVSTISSMSASSSESRISTIKEHIERLNS